MRISDWSSDVCPSDLLVLSPNALADAVSGPAALSLSARLLSEAARDTTLGYRNSAEADAAFANASKLASIDARDLAKMYRDDAASHAANLLTAMNSASASASAAIAADRKSTRLNSSH